MLTHFRADRKAAIIANRWRELVAEVVATRYPITGIMSLYDTLSDMETELKLQLESIVGDLLDDDNVIDFPGKGDSYE